VTQHVLVEKSEKLLVLTLNRPDKKNALTRAMYATLAAEIANADADPDIRCILIKANGDMFTAGNDLSDFAAIGNAGYTFLQTLYGDDLATDIDPHRRYRARAPVNIFSRADSTPRSPATIAS